MASSFVGTWETEFEGLGTIRSATVTLTVTESKRFDSSGKTLDGMHEGLRGNQPSTLHGAFDDRKLEWTGTWANAPGSNETGDFTFTLGKDNKTFTGTWSLVKDNRKTKNWNGKRIRNHQDIPEGKQKEIPPFRDIK